MMTPPHPALEIRPIRPDDADALRDFHAHLSPESIYLRYFSPHPTLSDADVFRFTNVDGKNRLAVVAFTGSRMAGVARADRIPGTARAEVAVIVADEFQGQGIGTTLLERLIAEARRVGIGVLEADTLMTNHRMLSVFYDLGLPVRSHLEFGVVRVSMDLAPNAGYNEACRSRRRADRSD